MGRVALFRCDASAEIGGGHVMRCLTLANALSALGWTCEMATIRESLTTVPTLSSAGHRIHQLTVEREHEIEALQQLRPEGCNIFILDHYQRGLAEEQAARNWANRLLVIDDMPSRRHECDILLDQNLGRTDDTYRALVPHDCRTLLGIDYALLRPQFADAREAAMARRHGSPDLQRLLLTLGYTDPLNLTEIVLEGVRQSGLAVAVDVVLGGMAPHLHAVRRRVEGMGDAVRVVTDVENMSELMLAADLAIGGAGSTAWERCCLGLPTLTVIGAENQLAVNDALVAAGAAHSLGWHHQLEAGHIANAILEFAGDRETQDQMQDAAFSICDGQGTARVVETLNQPYG